MAATNFVNIDTIKHEEATASLLRNRPGMDKRSFTGQLNIPQTCGIRQRNRFGSSGRRYLPICLCQTHERQANANKFYKDNKGAMHGKEIIELWPEMINYLAVRKEICDVGLLGGAT